MKVHMKNLLLSAIAVCFILLLFPNCGGESSKNCNLFEFSTENKVTTRMATAATVLNPIVTRTGSDTYIVNQLFQTFALVEPQTMELVPILIKKIPVVRKVENGPFAGSLAYDFEIYDNAVWDNGSPITGHDLIFTIKTILHPTVETRLASYFPHLQDVEVDSGNPKKFTVYFSKYYMLALQSLCQTPICPAYNYDPEGQLTNIPLKDFIDPERIKALLESNPALSAWATEFQLPRFANDKNAISGSGPYRLENYDVDQGCTLVKKQNWWGDRYVSENPYLGAFPAKLVYRFMTDDGAIENLMRTGGLDIIPDISPAKFIALKKDSCLAEKYDFKEQSTTMYGRLMLNHNNPKLADKRVRQAIAHTVDYDYLMNTVYQGFSRRIVGPINTSKSYYAGNIALYDYNIQKAKELLAAAGWKDTNGNGIADKTIDGQTIEMDLSLLTAISPVSRDAAKSIATTARSAGINMNVIEKDLSVVRTLTVKGDYDVCSLGASLFPGLVDFYQTYHTKSIGTDNRFNYSSPKADALLEAIRSEPDDTKRNMLFIRLQELVHDELTEIYLFEPQQRVIVSKRFNSVVSANRPGYYEQFFRLIK